MCSHSDCKHHTTKIFFIKPDTHYPCSWAIHSPSSQLTVKTPVFTWCMRVTCAIPSIAATKMYQYGVILIGESH